MNFKKSDKSERIYSEIAKTFKRDFKGGASKYALMSEKDIIDEIKSYDSKTRYKAFSFSLTGSDYNKRQYFDMLKKQGYNAIIDDQDAGSYSKSPMIVFDRYKDLKYDSVKKIVDNYRWIG